MRYKEIVFKDKNFDEETGELQDVIYESNTLNYEIYRDINGNRKEIKVSIFHYENDLEL